MQKLYSEEGTAALRSRARRAGRAALATAAVCLAGSVAMCFGVRTRNADLRQLLAIFVSALGGWATIGLWEGVRLPAAREAEHEAGVMRAPEEKRRGEILSFGARVAIPKSIAFLPVTFRTEDKTEGETLNLKLNTRFEKDFPAPGTHVRLETRRGYITGWEEEAHV